jgi:hypothetical protein
MLLSSRRLVLGALAWGLLSSSEGRAEQVRFRFVPTDAKGNLTQIAAGPNGALGERLRGLGLTAEAYPYALRPNQLVTFRHPFTGANVTVPLRLPTDTPRLEHASDRISFNYGSYFVQARFFQDGSVETIYNSGLLRPLRFD